MKRPRDRNGAKRSGIAFRVDDAGIASAAQQIPSPNRDPRPHGCAVELVVVHGISLPPGRFGGPGVIELFTNRIDPDAHPFYAELKDLRVSSHFFVRRDGTLIQFVACAERAWHAGVSQWQGRDRCNDFSVGIELEGTDSLPYASAQYRALATLIRALQRRYPIRDVVGHSDVAPGRKTDPGAAFDWPRLRRCILRARSRR